MLSINLFPETVVPVGKKGMGLIVSPIPCHSGLRPGIYGKAYGVAEKVSTGKGRSRKYFNAS